VDGKCCFDVTKDDSCGWNWDEKNPLNFVCTPTADGTERFCRERECTTDKFKAGQVMNDFNSNSEYKCSSARVD